MAHEVEQRVLASYLDESHLKHTRQREAILEVFLETRGHISSEDLASKVRELHPRIGYTTVCRTLKILCQAGLASERHFDDGLARWEIKQKHHDHLVCVRCRKIIEFESSAIERTQRELAKRHGFHLLRHRHELYGYCRECQREGAAEEDWPGRNRARAGAPGGRASMRLRQIALAARDLDAATDDLCAVLGIEIAFRDPGVRIFGLRNAVMPVAGTFLEVVSPVDPGASAARWIARRGGDSGYMVILQTPDLAAERSRLEALGVRVVWEASLEDIATIHLHPRDLGGAILSLDEPRPPESWRWAGPWRARVRTERVGPLRGAVLQAEDPEALAGRWGEVLGLPVAPGGSPGERGRIELEGAVLRFAEARDGRGGGLAGIELEAVDAARCLSVARERGLETDGERAVRICGTRIAFV